ncbi:MAG: DUF4190 domain-containing protein [Mycobacteriales bacterium]
MTDDPASTGPEQSGGRDVPPDRVSSAARRSALAKRPAAKVRDDADRSGANKDSGNKDGDNKITWSDSTAGTARPRNGMSIAALVVGAGSLIGLLILGLLDIIFIIAAIVLGVLALLRIKRGLGGRKSFAIAGIAAGLVAAILFGVLVYTTSRRIDSCGHKLGRDLHGLSSKDLQTALKQCDKKK